MIVVLSSAKTLDFSQYSLDLPCTIPSFLNQTRVLIKSLRELSVKELRKLLAVSDELAELNYSRLKKFKTPLTIHNAKPAILAYKGDVYQSLDLRNYKKQEFEYAQNHLRIISGLYGLLKPLDLIQAYRLEMEAKFKTNKINNLYDYWREQVSKELEIELKKTGLLVNLASEQYFSAIKVNSKIVKIVTPIFKDRQNGSYKTVALFAKKARGFMTDFMIKNKIKKADELKEFDSEGYKFNSKLSKDLDLVFTRG